MKCFCKRDGVIILLHCFTASLLHTLASYSILSTITILFFYLTILLLVSKPARLFVTSSIIYNIYALRDNFKPARPSIVHFSGSGLVATDCYNHDLRLSCLCGGLLAYTSGSYLRCRKLLDIYTICIIYLVIHSIIFAFIFQSCIMIKS